MTSTLQSTDLLASAVTAGLVTAREAAEGAVEVQHSTLMVHGRAIAYARCAQPGGLPHEPAGTIRELQCLRQLAGTDLVPEVLSSGPDGIWTGAVRGIRLSALTGTMAELAETCHAWGSALAALHLTRIAGGEEIPVAPRPWVLDPDRLPRIMRHVPSGSARAFVLRTLRTDRGLLRTVDRVADRWSVDHWTHGELTADTVLVQRAPDLRVRFVDLRRGGLGDPSWDLTGALETVAELTGGPRAPWQPASGSCLCDYLLRGYRRAGGTTQVDAGTRALRIVSRAWEAAAALDTRAVHPAVMHPAAGHPYEAGRLTERLRLACELAARSVRPGLVAA